MQRERLDGSIFYPGFQLPSCVKAFSGPLLILGTARCLLDDLDRYGTPPGDVFAVKQAGLFYWRFRHWWVSDTTDWPLWHNLVVNSSKSQAFGVPFSVHALTAFPGKEIDYHWQFNPRIARSAGPEATIAALAMGYDPIVLAGMPGDGTGHFFPDQRYKPGLEPMDYGEGEHRVQWEILEREIFKGRVKSMSGLTREILGEPVR